MLYDFLWVVLILSFLLAITLEVSLIVALFELRKENLKLKEEPEKKVHKPISTKEIDKFNAIMNNIDCYNGTPIGQVEVNE